MGACAAAGKSPPWTGADESVRSVSVSDVATKKESEFGSQIRARLTEKISVHFTLLGYLSTFIHFMRMVSELIEASLFRITIGNLQSCMPILQKWLRGIPSLGIMESPLQPKIASGLCLERTE